MKDILIGLIIGVGKIIPGVSGSVLAITLGVYEKIIYSINNIFKDYKNLYYLSKLGIGIIVSIVFLSRIIIYLLSNYYTYTIFIFIGLLCGSMKEITTNTKLKYSYLTVLSFIVIIILGMINISNTNHDGTALLMLIGTYNMVIELFSNIINIRYLINNMHIIIPFIFGMLVGIIISIKLIGYLFNRYKSQTYNIILGLLLGSIFIMIKGCSFDISNIFISIFLFIISYLSIKKVNHLR